MNQKWMNLLNTNKVEDVRTVVQAAIEVEHATMPPYLYAMYSLGATNPSINDTLRSIVIEEMLHMLLACNLLNAIGGTPRIDSPDFVINYPSPLPGSINSGFCVALKPFSRHVCETVFMQIEDPQHPINFHIQAEAGLEAALTPSATIGEFYTKLKASLQPSFFTGTAANQANHYVFQNILSLADQHVTDLPSAIRALDVIMHQGEGTSDNPYEAPGALAHYYRFAELVNGKLIPNPTATPASPPNKRYVYDGHPIAIAPGILPLVDNPRAANYTPGTPERNAVDACNKVYTKVLASLQRAFSGQPATLDDAVSLMQYDLGDSIRDVMALPDPNQPGKNCGPSFEYLV
jgi:hypothetical protein